MNFTYCEHTTDELEQCWKAGCNQDLWLLNHYLYDFHFIIGSVWRDILNQMIHKHYPGILWKGS